LHWLDRVPEFLRANTGNRNKAKNYCCEAQHFVFHGMFLLLSDYSYPYYS
jgi:hypothetical protein